MSINPTMAKYANVIQNAPNITGVTGEARASLENTSGDYVAGKISYTNDATGPAPSFNS